MGERQDLIQRFRRIADYAQRHGMKEEGDAALETLSQLESMDTYPGARPGAPKPTRIAGEAGGRAMDVPSAVAARPKAAKSQPEDRGFLGRALDEAKAEGGALYQMAKDAIPGTETVTVGSPREEELKAKAWTFGSRAANQATLGLANRAIDENDPDMARARDDLYARPETQSAGTAGDVAGVLTSALAGPAAWIDRGVTAVGGALGRMLAPNAPRAMSTLGSMLTGGASAATQNTAQNVVEGRPALEGTAEAVTMGAGVPFAARAAGSGARLMRGTERNPTWVGRYRNAVERDAAAPGTGYQHKALPEESYEGIVPTPEDIAEAGVAPGRPASMRDVREASEYAGGQAVAHRAGKTNQNYRALEAEVKPFLETPVSRQALISDIRAQMAENQAKGLGTVDSHLQRNLQRMLDKLEMSRPAPRQVLEGVKPHSQPELPLPGAPPIPQSTPPMSLPREQYQARIPFGEQPPGPGPYGAQPTPPLAVPAEAHQNRFPFALDDVSGQPVGVAPSPDGEWIPPAQRELLPTSAPVRPPTQIEMSAPPQPPPVPGPAIQPTSELVPPSGRTGEQMEINAPPAPPPIPGLEPSGGVGPYQREISGIDPEPRMLSVEEAMGDPTLGGLRRLRQQARKRANFENPGPLSTAEQNARDEYFSYDRAIKRTAPPEYLDIEKRMAESAAGSRAEGDLIAKTEGAIGRGESGVAAPTYEASADDLGLTVADDAADASNEAMANAEAKRAGVKNPNVRVGKRQQIGTFFQRVGDENVPGKNARSAHEDLAARDPKYAEHQQLVYDMKALDAVKPGWRAMIPLDFNQATAGGQFPEIARQNLRFLAGQLGVPLLEGAARQGPKGARLVPLLRDPMDALMERRKSETGKER